MSYQSQLDVLEKLFPPPPYITVWMPDGTIKEIHAKPSEAVLDFYMRLSDNPNCEESLLIKQSVAIAGPGTSLLGEMLLAQFQTLADPSPPFDESEPALPWPTDTTESIQ